MTDALWAEWAAARGWSAAESATKLDEVSERARSETAQGNKAYSVLTSLNAVDIVQRARSTATTSFPVSRPRASALAIIHLTSSMTSVWARASSLRGKVLASPS